MISSTSQIRVRYAETDMMGIAYHANYLTWFEIARVQLLDEIELPYARLEQDGYRLPVLEVAVRYLKSAVFDDRLSVEVTMAEKPGVRFNLDYSVRRGAETLATGSTTHAFIDRQGSPVRPPASFVEKIKRCF